MKNLAKRLEGKGWAKRDIKKAIGIIDDAKQNKPADIRFLDKKVYWALLIIVAVANFAISIALLPILMALKGVQLYFIISVLGIVFGLLFELVIRSIEHLEKKHHIALVFLIPLIAVANLFVINNLANNVMAKLGLANYHNSFLVSISYAVSFVIPYIIYRFVLKIEYYARE